MPQRVPSQEESQPKDVDASKLTADQILAVRELVRQLGGIDKAKRVADKLSRDAA